ncbi:hypothetical protein B0H13DRAFT_1877256 [Mycena leptocephala]|nr:hypothetical protein B0H13DRAFT_1877256 [Mycena leptocephala]
MTKGSNYDYLFKVVLIGDSGVGKSNRTGLNSGGSSPYNPPDGSQNSCRLLGSMINGQILRSYVAPTKLMGIAMEAVHTDARGPVDPRTDVTTNPELYLDNSNFRYSHIRRSASPSPSDELIFCVRNRGYSHRARPLYADALKTPVNTYSYIEQNSYYIEWFRRTRPRSVLRRSKDSYLNSNELVAPIGRQPKRRFKLGYPEKSLPLVKYAPNMRGKEILTQH